MRRALFGPGSFVGPSLLLSAPLLWAACAAAPEETPNVPIETNLAVPKGVLDRANALTLTVLEGNVACDPATGAVTFPGGAAAAKEVAKSELVASTTCAGGAKFCGSLQIAKSAATRIFSAVAKDASSTTLAVGCTQAKVEQDALPISIKMFRYLQPASCGDGTVQPTEQCEPGGTPSCDEQCQSNEALVSVGSPGNGTQSGGVGDKTAPFLLWPALSGDQGRFFAFFTDRSGSNVDIGLRVMSDELEPLSSPPALGAGSIFLPNGASFPPAREPRTQSVPQAAALKGKYYVVFQDDNTAGSNGLDIHLRSMDGSLVADQGAAPVGINGASGAGEANIQAAPAIAATADRLYVAWEDQAQGRIVGRTLTPPSTLGNQNEISTGTGNKGVSLASTGTGFVAVWQSGTGVKLRILNQDGTPQGGDQTVNESGSVVERPRVASLPDGRFAVTWASAGDIFVQRYDAKGAKIPGDQNVAINDVVKDGEQKTPSIGSTPAAGGSYAVAWLDVGSNNVNARMLGGTSGFLFNNVNGQSTEFQASRLEGRTRVNPVVVAGGSGPFVAIGWEDQTSPGAGIAVRRFPLPSE